MNTNVLVIFALALAALALVLLAIVIVLAWQILRQPAGTSTHTQFFLAIGFAHHPSSHSRRTVCQRPCQTTGQSITARSATAAINHRPLPSLQRRTTTRRSFLRAMRTTLVDQACSLEPGRAQIIPAGSNKHRHEGGIGEYPT